MRAEILRTITSPPPQSSDTCEEHSKSEQRHNDLLKAPVLRESINVSLILRLHESLGINTPSSLRKSMVLPGITGVTHFPPNHDEVAGLLDAFCGALREKIEVWCGFSAAALALWFVNNIHPFSDGNGRTARGLAFLVLRMATLLPDHATLDAFHAAFHRCDERKRYYAGLAVTNEAVGVCECCSAAPMQHISTRMLSSVLSEDSFASLASLLRDVVKGIS